MNIGYALHGIDDLLTNNTTKLCNVLNVKKPDILCFGTGLEDYCNYRCIYCYAGNISKKKKEDILSLKQYFELFQQAIDLGCKSVIITGALSMAEPLMSPKLLPVIDFLYKRKVTTVLFTNASILGDDALCESIHGVNGEKLCEILYNSDVSMIISCDSLENAKYDKIVAINGAHIKFNKAISRINKIGYTTAERMDQSTILSRIAFSTVISKENFDELEVLKEYCHSHNWQYICKFPSLMGNAITNLNKFFSPEEVKVHKKAINKYSDKPQTLSIIQNEKRYCLMNQLGIAMNNRGDYLTCLSGRVAFEKNDSCIKGKTLKDITLLKKARFGCQAGACPKKTKYYGNLEV